MEENFDELTIIRNEFMNFKSEFRSYADSEKQLLKNTEKLGEQLRETIRLLGEIFECISHREEQTRPWDEMEYIPTYRVLRHYNISRKYLYYYRMEHGLKTIRIGKTNYYLRSEIENMGRDITCNTQNPKEPESSQCTNTKKV